MPQPLEETSGLFTNPDQTEEEERTWRANRLARAQAKLMAMLLAVRPQDNPRGHGSLTVLLEVKPTGLSASNTSQLATGPKVPKRTLWSVPSLYMVIGGGTIPSPKGEGGSHSRVSCAGRLRLLGDSGDSSQQAVSIKKPWVVLDVAGKKTDFLKQYGSHLPCPDFSLWTSFL